MSKMGDEQSTETRKVAESDIKSEIGNTEQKMEINGDNVGEWKSIETSYGESIVYVYKCDIKNGGNIVYFGGDIQNKSSEMNEYKEFSFESTLNILRDKFGNNNNIILIKPERMYKSISVFSNFLMDVDKYGQSVPITNLSKVWYSTYKNAGICHKNLIEILKEVNMYYYPINIIGIPIHIPKTIYFCYIEYIIIQDFPEVSMY